MKDTSMQLPRIGGLKLSTDSHFLLLSFVGEVKAKGNSKS